MEIVNEGKNLLKKLAISCHACTLTLTLDATYRL